MGKGSRRISIIRFIQFYLQSPYGALAHPSAYTHPSRQRYLGLAHSHYTIESTKRLLKLPLRLTIITSVVQDVSIFKRTNQRSH